MEEIYKPDWTEKDCIEKCANYKSHKSCDKCKRPFEPIYNDLFGSGGIVYNEDNFKNK